MELTKVFESMSNDCDIYLTDKGKTKLSKETFLEEKEIDGKWYIDSIKHDGTITIVSNMWVFTTVECDDIKLEEN